MNINGALGLLNLTPAQQDEFVASITSPLNRFFAYETFGHPDPDEDELVRQFIAGGGVDAFRREHSIPQA